MESIGSWLRENKKILAIVASIFMIVIIVIIIGYQLGWTGFNVSSVTVQTNAPKRTTLPTNITVTLPSKTLYDWLQLLIVPLALAAIALVFQLANTRTERQIAKERYEQDQQITLDRQREDLLQTYLDRMSELLLKENLRSSAADAEVRNVARVRTITILTQLDARRIGYVFAFLRESELMSTTSDGDVVNLSNVELQTVNWSRANLRGTNLSQINLSGANLSKSNMSGANLIQAELSGATLVGANLIGANLSKARLSGANLSNINLTGANLSGALLSEADLTGAILADANLSEAILSRANLRNVNFRRANLEGAHLSEVNLIGANLAQSNFREASSLRDATMPDGSKHD